MQRNISNSSSFQISDNKGSEVSLPVGNKYAYYNQTIKTELINSSVLKETIVTVRNEICSVTPGSKVKVHFTFDAQAKLFGIGASSEAGIEITFNC